MSAKKAKFVFSPEHDLELLKIVRLDPPFRCKHGLILAKWDELLVKLGWNISRRTLSERFDLLVEKFKSTNRENLKKSGTEEEYAEKEILLEEICVMIEEPVTAAVLSKTGHEIREKSLKLLQSPTETSHPTPKRKKEMDILDVILKQQDQKAETASKKLETEKKSLELEEKRLLLEEKKLETEREKLEFERKQREEEQKQSFEERKLMFELMKQVLNKLS